MKKALVTGITGQDQLWLGNLDAKRDWASRAMTSIPAPFAPPAA